MIGVELEKGEDLCDITNRIRFQPSTRVNDVSCPECKRELTAFVWYDIDEHKEAERIEIECKKCGYKDMIAGKDLDVIQPSSPFFIPVYQYDPAEMGRKKREAKKEKELDRKEGLMRKYYKMEKQGRLKPWERESLEDIVVKDKSLWPKL